MDNSTLRIEQFFEEIGEAICFTLILCANIVLLLRLIKRVRNISDE